MTTYVYILRERGSTIARYVGQSGYPEYRFIQHRRTAGYMPKPTAFAQWLLTADVEWVELTGYPTAAEARKAERDLITALITLGHPLFNLHGVPIEQRAPRYAMPTRKPADATSIAA